MGWRQFEIVAAALKFGGVQKKRYMTSPAKYFFERTCFVWCNGYVTEVLFSEYSVTVKNISLVISYYTVFLSDFLFTTVVLAITIGIKMVTSVIERRQK